NFGRGSGVGSRTTAQGVRSIEADGQIAKLRSVPRPQAGVGRFEPAPPILAWARPGPAPNSVRARSLAARRRGRIGGLRCVRPLVVELCPRTRRAPRLRGDRKSVV